MIELTGLLEDFLYNFAEESLEIMSVASVAQFLALQRGYNAVSIQALQSVITP